MIEALPANITLDNAADVQAARQAYDALSDTDKAQIDAATLKKLTDAEAKIADLTAAKAVSDAITALPAYLFQIFMPHQPRPDLRTTPDRIPISTPTVPIRSDSRIRITYR